VCAAEVLTSVTPLLIVSVFEPVPLLIVTFVESAVVPAPVKFRLLITKL